jgi:uncharacterized protein YndB with AHSA1/START domain
MIWFLAAAGVLALIVAGLTILGLSLPREHQAAVSARFPTAAAELWRLVADFDARARWRSDVKRIERAPDVNGHPVYVEVGRHGPLPLEVAESIPEKRLVLRIADVKLPFGGSWIHEFSADADGTVLTITEDGHIENPLFRALARYVFGYHATLETVLKQLGRHCGADVHLRRITYLTNAHGSR